MILAWHFTGDKLRDGRPIPPVGEWLEHEGPIALCKSGLHASVDILDALRYAPGPILHRVELDGEIIEDEDKLVASRRKILWSVDLTDTLRAFARACALDVVHLRDCPDIVRQYLETGDESIRAAARSVAGALLVAAWPTAGVASLAAACSAAAWDACNAAWDTACTAAQITGLAAASLDAAWDKQRERLLEMVAKKSGRE